MRQKLFEVIRDMNNTQLHLPKLSMNPTGAVMNESQYHQIFCEAQRPIVLIKEIPDGLGAEVSNKFKFGVSDRSRERVV